jgi:hypothetical protein
LCFGKITNLMTAQNMWQSHHSFYGIDCDIRLTRKNNELDQQNNNESERRASVSENSSNHETSGSDSAYILSPSVARTDSNISPVPSIAYSSTLD